MTTGQSKKSMTPSRGDFTYDVLIETGEFLELYHRMAKEGLLWAMFPEVPSPTWTEQIGLMYLDRNEQLVLAGYYKGELAGFMTLLPTRVLGRCCEIGLLAFRAYFDIAIDLCKGAILWALENQNIDSLIGYIPKPSRHSKRLIEKVGFKCLGEVPGYTWYDKAQKFVPSYIVVADRKSLGEACYGWKSKYSGSGTDSGEAADKTIERGSKSGSCGSSGQSEKESGNQC